MQRVIQSVLVHNFPIRKWKTLLLQDAKKGRRHTSTFFRLYVKYSFFVRRWKRGENFGATLKRKAEKTKNSPEDKRKRRRRKERRREPPRNYKGNKNKVTPSNNNNNNHDRGGRVTGTWHYDLRYWKGRCLKGATHSLTRSFASPHSTSLHLLRSLPRSLRSLVGTSDFWLVLFDLWPLLIGQIIVH